VKESFKDTAQFGNLFSPELISKSDGFISKIKHASP
jgi:hypothetical protein